MVMRKMNDYHFSRAKTKLPTCLALHYCILFILLLACFGSIPHYCVGLIPPPQCHPSQEEALLKVKAGLTDPTDRLESWQLGVDCCKWSGITCDNRTGYVIAIDLHNPKNPYDNLPFDRYAKRSSDSIGYSSLGGRLDPALADLKRLQYLDLSLNAFDQKVRIPDFLGSMVELGHLDLSYAGFGGRIPASLGNLSKLEYLDLSSLIHNDAHSRYPQALNGVTRSNSALTSYLSCDDLQWVAGLVSLKFFSMKQVNLSMVSHEPMHFFNSLPSLEDLALSFCSFSTGLNLPFSNFSSLEILDLSNTFLVLDFPNWVVNVSSLRHMDISNSYFEGEIPYSLSELPDLRYANLNFNEYLKVNCTKFLAGRWRSIERLGLYNTDFNGGIPSSIGNITSLIELGASHSFRSHTGLEGNIPRELGKLKNLEGLALKYKNIVGTFLPNTFNPYRLKVLDLIGVDMQGTLNLDWFCHFKFLEEISLTNCNLKGHIPTCLFQMPTLTSLTLDRNYHLNGTLPMVLRENSQLEMLSLSFNLLQGTVNEDHLQNLKNLKILDLSYNSILFKPLSTWSPPPLSAIILASCQVGPDFPQWLKDVPSLQYLDLSSNMISGPLPGWFWEKLPTLVQLNLSHNHIQSHLPSPLALSVVLGQTGLDLGFNRFYGPVPSFTSGIDYLDLSYNRLTGPLPSNISSSLLGFLDFFASNNEINGEIPLAFGEMKRLQTLDLSNNKLIGSIPPNLIGSTSLQSLDLSGNLLSGETNWNLPKSNLLRSLHFGKNFLNGTFPRWLTNCTHLEVLDLSQNRFFGEIPRWVGKYCTSLKILDLKSNMFTGRIPWQLSLLSSLQVLNVAHNSLHGSIPKSYGNFKAMKEKHVVKQLFPLNDGYYRDKLTISMSGKEVEYGNNLFLVNSLDLSSNKFQGEIPQELTNLSELLVLNLSHNQLVRNIPGKIGALMQLLTLDFSHNHLSGRLPQSLASLTFLSQLNVSYNNFSGEIPTGSQLQTFKDTAYIGNPLLCGAPLMNNCSDNTTLGSPNAMAKQGEVEDDDKGPLDMFGFYVSMAPGYVVGFWSVCATLILKTMWRTAYFRFFDEVNSRIFVMLVIRLPQLLKWILKKGSPNLTD